MYLLVYIKGGSHIYTVVVYLKPKKHLHWPFLGPKTAEQSTFSYVYVYFLDGM